MRTATVLTGPRPLRGIATAAAGCALVAAVLPPAHAARAHSVTYSTPGTYTFTVPPGITRIDVAATAGGGGGGGSMAGAFPVPGDGGGGGGGATTVRCSLAVGPGGVLTLDVAAGGAAGQPSRWGGKGDYSVVTVGSTRAVFVAGGFGGWPPEPGGQGGAPAAGNCDGGTRVTIAGGVAGAPGGRGGFHGHGGAGGAAGQPVPSTCPDGTGRGGDGAAGGVFTGYAGNAGGNGCVVLTY
ncbi:hypothetical protein AB0L05_34090 [Nonomuraea pusilla]|uniref:glycine-rich domain-containing protein n=1 Tax=Nonomuraea pusilla TaxID=46177 RepID=UPI00332FFC7D